MSRKAIGMHFVKIVVELGVLLSDPILLVWC